MTTGKHEDKILKNYIPLFIFNKVKEKTFSGEEEGSALFTDISGFTAMTEMLFEKGERGTEEISRQLLNVFDEPVNIVYRHKGYVTSFAGDAFTVVFPEDNGIKAYSAAVDIINFFKEKGRRKTPFGELEFNCRCGVGIGLFRWNIFETSKDSLSYYFSGSAIDEALKQSEIIEKGKIGISEEIKYCPSLIDETTVAEIPYDILSKFILPGILSLKSIGELRHISSVFIEVKEKDEKKVEESVRIIYQEVRKMGGTFNKIDYGDKGLVSINYFGAPEAKERPEELAVRFSYRLLQKGINVSIGIDSGLCYAGRTGGYRRGEWTCLGNVVNTSSRIMSFAGENKVFVSKRVKERANKIGEFKFFNKIKLKGKKYPEEINILSDLKGKRSVEFKYAMVGRAREFSLLYKFNELIFNEKNAGVSYIYGEAGIGKSRLVWEMLNFFVKKESRLLIIYLPCEEATKSPWNPLVDWLRDYFISDEKEPSKEGIENKIKRFDNPKLTKRVSFLASIIGIEWDGSAYSMQSEKRRKEGQIFVLKELIKEISKEQKIIIFIDDFQRIDELTAEWLASLTRNVPDYPFSVICTSRYDDRGSKPRINLDSRVRTLEIDLNPFEKDEEICTMVEHITGIKSSNDLRIHLIEKSQGNPFFLEQTILYLKDQNILKGNPLNIVGEVERLPETLSDLLTARLDSMEMELRDIVKRASVIGERFLIELLRKIVNEEIQDELEFFLEKGEEDQVLTRELNYEDTYLFRHTLLREAAYQLYLPSERKKLHRIILEVAEDLLKKEINSHLTLFVEQAERGEKWKKWEIYIQKYLNYLEKMYANDEILRICAKMENFYSKKKDFKKHIGILIKAGKILKRIGKNDEAILNFNRAIKLSTENNKELLKAEALNFLGSSEISARKYDKAEKAYKEALEIVRRQNDLGLECKIQGNIGVLYVNKGKLNKALLNYEKTLNIARRTEDIKDEVTVLYNIGAIKAQMKNYDEARKYFENSLEIAEKYEFFEEKAGVMLNLGVLEANLENLNLAEDFFQKAHSVFKEFEIKEGEMFCLNNLGEMYLQEKNFEIAKKINEEYLELSKEIGNRNGETNALLKLGKIALQNDKINKMKVYFEEVIKMKDEMKDNTGKVKLIFEIADLLEKNKKIDLSLKYFEKADKINLKLNNSSIKYEIAFRIANILVNKREEEKALKYMKIAEENKEMSKKIENLKKKIKK